MRDLHVQRDNDDRPVVRDSAVSPESCPAKRVCVPVPIVFWSTAPAFNYIDPNANELRSFYEFHPKKRNSVVVAEPPLHALLLHFVVALCYCPSKSG